MSSSFSDLGLPAAAVDALAARGITEAFPIQTLALPPALEGRDVCGKAPTGSGKTLAFGLPLAERVGRATPRRPKALVLAPTRELAAQITDELRALLQPRRRHVHAFYGGVGFGPQVSALRRGVDVAVACPGRLADLINSGEIDLGDVEIAVIDEADRMADMGFLPEVKRLLDQVRHDRQTLLFSATLDGDVDVLIRRYQRDPVRCELEVDDDHHERTSHHLVDVRREDRIATAAQIVAQHGSTVVFCRTKHGTDRVARQLGKAGVDAVPIHGGRSQAQRTRALAAFTDGRAQALVATDVAARGIHVDDVACVVHYDVAGDHKDYLHRSGRTGRAGADGVVVTLVVDGEARKKVRELRRHLEVEFLDGAPDAPARPAVRRPAGGDDRSAPSRSSRGDSPKQRGGGGKGSSRRRSDGRARSDQRRGRGSGDRRRSGTHGDERRDEGSGDRPRGGARTDRDRAGSGRGQKHGSSSRRGSGRSQEGGSSSSRRQGSSDGGPRSSSTSRRSGSKRPSSTSSGRGRSSSGSGRGKGRAGGGRPAGHGANRSGSKRSNRR